SPGCEAEATVAPRVGLHTGSSSRRAARPCFEVAPRARGPTRGATRGRTFRLPRPPRSRGSRSGSGSRGLPTRTLSGLAPGTFALLMGGIVEVSLVSPSVPAGRHADDGFLPSHSVGVQAVSPECSQGGDRQIGAVGAGWELLDHFGRPG